MMKDCNHCMAYIGGICRAEECHGSVSGFFDGDGDKAAMAAEAYQVACEALGLVGGNADDRR